MDEDQQKAVWAGAAGFMGNPRFGDSIYVLPIYTLIWITCNIKTHIVVHFNIISNTKNPGWREIDHLTEPLKAKGVIRWDDYTAHRQRE